MMPCVSAQRHPDHQCTMFILNLPVVIVAVPAGSLPSALSLAGSPSMPRSERKRTQTKSAGPNWKICGSSINCCCDQTKGSVLWNLWRVSFENRQSWTGDAGVFCYNLHSPPSQIQSCTCMKTFLPNSATVIIMVCCKGIWKMLTKTSPTFKFQICLSILLVCWWCLFFL